MYRLLRSLFLILFIPLTILQAKLPQIYPRDVKKKIQEVLRAHVSYKDLNEEILKRSINNFIDELDPTKTYFTKPEIAQWQNPEKSILDRILQEFKKGDYRVFNEIHELFCSLIPRRDRLENDLDKEQIAPYNKALLSDEELDWVEDKKALKKRLRMFKSIHLQASEKIADESKDTFIERIKKRRKIRQNQIVSDESKEREKWILTHVLKAVVAALDSHTNYFTPSEAAQFMIQVQQRLFGIGVQLKDNLNGFSVERILEGGPAFMNKKLKIKDLIIAVNHEPIVGMDILEAVEQIRGEKDTPVLLTIARENGESIETFDLELTRGEVVLEESRMDTSLEPFADGVIAHLRLYSFYQDGTTSSAKDLANAIENIKSKHKLKGILLDLRSNSGGILPQAVEVAGLFIKKGIVASIKDNSGKVQHLRNIREENIWDGPLVVLTNKASASAAEIVAQSLQDYGRALVVGDKKTFGKGTFQTFTLDATTPDRVNPKGEFKVTRGRYYTVSGKSPQLVGVFPDIEVPGLLSALEIGEEFAKYPLNNDSIDPNFIDTLSDIPLIHRKEIERIYKYNLQEKIDRFAVLIPQLKNNSKKRLENNEPYRNFIKDSQEKTVEVEAIDFFGNNDFQLCETINILKDMIFLLEIR
jgi:carboxyl-terminal processing protease